jgi:hypothetical protein
MTNWLTLGSSDAKPNSILRVLIILRSGACLKETTIVYCHVVGSIRRAKIVAVIGTRSDAMENQIKKDAKPAARPRPIECELTDEDLVAVVGGVLKGLQGASGACLRRGRKVII